MGGKYPTSRGFHGGFEPKTGTFRPPSGVRVAPVNRPYGGFFPELPNSVQQGWIWGPKPETFNPSGVDYDIPHGKQPYGRRHFPDPWRPKNPPFGRKAPVAYASPLSLPRFPVWPGVAAAGLLVWYFHPRGISGPPGWIRCYDLGGPKDMQSGPVGFIGCSFQANFQAGVPMGNTWPYDPSWGNSPVSVFFGPDVFPPAPGTRLNYMEQWYWPGGPQTPNLPLEYLPPIRTPMPLEPMPLDPVNWLPLAPYTYVPTPWPVWDTPPYDPYQYPPIKSAGNRVPGAVIPLPPPKYPGFGVGPKGSFDTDGHTRGRPHKPRNYEGKYTLKGPFAAVALRLLQAASRVYNGITETVDLLAAIYSALPADVIAREPDNIPDARVIEYMLGAIWKYRDQIDMNKAAGNILENLIEDKAWGRYFKALNDVRRTTGANVEGWDRELGQLNDLFRELQSAT